MPLKTPLSDLSMTERFCFAGRKMRSGRKTTPWSSSRNCGTRRRRGTSTTAWAATLSSAGGSASTTAGRWTLRARFSPPKVFEFQSNEDNDARFCVCLFLPRLCGRAFCYYCCSNTVSTQPGGSRERCCMRCYHQHSAVVERHPLEEGSNSGPGTPFSRLLQAGRALTTAPGYTHTHSRLVVQMAP